MKLSNNLTRLIAVFFISSSVMIACQKENSSTSDLTPAQEELAVTSSSEADAEAELIFDGVFNDVMGANDEVGMEGTGVFGQKAENGNGETYRTDSTGPNPPSTRCFTVTVTSLNAPAKFPLKIVIDFGTAGCLGRDGHIRRGKIIATYTNRLIFPQASATTTFDNFSIDGTKVEGVHRITNTSTSSTRSYNVKVEGGKITKPNGDFSEWNSNKNITQIDGLGTPYVPFDDIYEITGSTNGKVKHGTLVVLYRSEIVKPLIKKTICRWIVKGEIKTWRATNNTSIAPANGIIAVLDFGNGDCDNKATLTVNGVTRQITLH